MTPEDEPESASGAGRTAAGTPVHPGRRHGQGLTAQLFHRGGPGAGAAFVRISSAGGTRTARQGANRRFRGSHAGVTDQRRPRHFLAGKLTNPPNATERAAAYRGPTS